MKQPTQNPHADSNHVAMLQKATVVQMMGNERFIPAAALSSSFKANADRHKVARQKPMLHANCLGRAGFQWGVGWRTWVRICAKIEIELNGPSPNIKVDRNSQMTNGPRVYTTRGSCGPSTLPMAIQEQMFNRPARIRTTCSSMYIFSG